MLDSGIYQNIKPYTMSDPVEAAAFARQLPGVDVIF